MQADKSHGTGCLCYLPRSHVRPHVGQYPHCVQELDKHASKSSSGTSFLWGSSRGTDKNKAALEEARAQVDELQRQILFLQDQLDSLKDENAQVGCSKCQSSCCWVLWPPEGQEVCMLWSSAVQSAQL